MLPVKSMLEQIKEAYSGLSKGQKAIADFILNHYEEAAYMTAARIGRPVLANRRSFALLQNWACWISHFQPIAR